MYFEFSIDGHTGESFFLQLKNGVLFCERQGEGYDQTKQVEVAVSVENNPDFAALIAYLHTRRWKSEYINAAVIDGTHWELAFVANNTRLSSSGSNQYPPGFFKVLRLLNKVMHSTGIAIY